jgi:hypothetical protein
MHVPLLGLIAYLLLLGAGVALAYGVVRVAVRDGMKDAMGFEPHRAFHGLGPERSPHSRP